MPTFRHLLPCIVVSVGAHHSFLPVPAFTSFALSVVPSVVSAVPVWAVGLAIRRHTCSVLALAAEVGVQQWGGGGGACQVVAMALGMPTLCSVSFCKAAVHELLVWLCRLQ